MSNLSELWESAHLALEQGEYERAITTLSEIQSFREIMRPQQLVELNKCFIKAYIYNGQIAEAKMLCLSLINTNHVDLKTWAEEKLAEIEPQKEIELRIDSKHQTDSKDRERIEPIPRSISEFKQFCLDNIMGILKAFERKRKKTIITIAISTIIFIIVVIAIAQGGDFLNIPHCSDLEDV